MALLKRVAPDGTKTTYLNCLFSLMSGSGEGQKGATAICSWMRKISFVPNCRVNIKGRLIRVPEGYVTIRS